MLTLYGREGCCLCDELYNSLIALGIGTEGIVKIDVDSRSELKALYGNRVPVLEKNGVEIGAGRVSAENLQQLLD